MVYLLNSLLRYVIICIHLGHQSMRQKLIIKLNYDAFYCIKFRTTKKFPVAATLQEDIQKSINNDEERVTREILQYMQGIRNAKMTDDELQMIVDFLAKLIVNTENSLVENIMFFPVIIRNNEEIIRNKDVGDKFNKRNF